MAKLHRTAASLILMGDDLDPSMVTEALGGRPTRSWRKGEDIRVHPDRPQKLARHGQWRREATQAEPEDVDAQVRELLSGLATDPRVWQQLSARFRVLLFCGWFMSNENEGVKIAASTLQLLGERGICLDLDIYAPDDDA